MLISKNLLYKILPNLKATPYDKFIDCCNSIGIEVEKKIEHPKLEGFCIGYIVNKEKHPNADKLSVCKVKIDDTNNYLTIVCGATNVCENKYVIVANNNAKLYDGKTIKYSEIRGVMSQGMLCSYLELTPNITFYPKNEKHHIILLDEAKLGDSNVGEYIGLNDEIFEIALPTNRPDLNSVYVFAKEIAAYFRWEFEIFAKIVVTNGENIEVVQYEKEWFFNINIIKISNVETTSNNWQMRGLLMNNGVEPKNKTFDTLSYISLLTSTTINIYDPEKINDLEIKLSNDKKTIDIFSNNQPIQPIQQNIEQCKSIIVLLFDITKNVINPSSLSKNKSKPTNTFLTSLCAKLICKTFNSILQTVGGENLEEQDTVAVDWDYIINTIGLNIKKDHVIKYLEFVGFKVEADIVTTPKYRTDIKTNQDIAEEVLKIIDINELPLLSIAGGYKFKEKNKENDLRNKITNLLLENHVSGVITKNLTYQENLDQFNVFKFTKFIKINDNKKYGRDFLRVSLIHGMLNIFQKNIAHKNLLEPIFEIQKIYSDIEHTNLTILTNDKIFIDRLANSVITINTNWLRSISDRIASICNVCFDYFHSTKDDDMFYQNDSISIKLANQTIGFIGAIKNKHLIKYDIHSPIYCLIINLEILFTLANETKKRINKPNDLMPVIRDINFTIDVNIDILHILKAIEELDFINEYYFIDKYNKSTNAIAYTIRFFIQNKQNQTTEEIDKKVDVLKRKLVSLSCLIS